MHRKYFLIILALTALCLFLIFTFFLATPEDKGISPKVLTPKSPFHTNISGVGVVESSSGNISIGIPFHRIVEKVNVAVNDHVKKGAILLELDDQDLQATLRVKQAEYEKVQAELSRMEALPRKEDLAIAEEALNRVQAAFNEAKTQYEMVSNLPSSTAISREEQDRRLSRYKQAEAELREQQSQYEKIKLGAWGPDLQIAKQQVAQAQADLEALKTEIARTKIRSPIDGTVLQIKLHPGETPGSDPSQAAIIIGDIDDLNLRVSVDQFNVLGLPTKPQAVAFRQGDHSEEFPLEFLYVEPLMIPKKYLTNAVDEQVDTQVFVILFRIVKKDPGLFIGEQMDVFIDKSK